MHIFKGASMDNGRYWQKRFAALEDMQYQKSREYIHDVENSSGQQQTGYRWI